MRLDLITIWTVTSWRNYELSKDKLGELRVDLQPISLFIPYIFLCDLSIYLCIMTNPSQLMIIKLVYA